MSRRTATALTWPTAVQAEWGTSTVARQWRMLAAVGALLALTEAAARTGVWANLQPLSVTQVVSDILFAIGFGCPLVLFVSALPPWREAVAAAAIGALLTAGLIAGLAAPAAPAGVIGFGLGCLAVLARAAFGARTESALAGRLFFLPSAVALLYTLQAAIFLNFLALQLPLTYDPSAYVADSGYGFQPSFAAGRLFAAAPPLAWICFAIYAAPPPILIYVYALQVRSRRPPPVDAITELLVLGLSGYALYFLYPVCGPLFAFDAAFPHQPPDAAALAAAPMMAVPASHAAHVAWRNAMPSLHFGSVVLAWWLARPLGAWPRRVSAIFVIATALATLGLGEHYAVDLVVALPFTLLVHALCSGRIVRDAAVRWIAAICATLTLVWYALLFDAARLSRTPFLMWGLTLVTVSAVVLLERGMHAAPRGAAAAAEQAA